MPKADQTEIRLRIVIENPVPGVAHSLQDKKNHPVDAKSSKGGKPLSFEFPVRIADGPKFYGEQVRPEGPERRFVYIAIGTLAGDPASCWTRRMKIDIHDIRPVLLEKAKKGKTLEIVINGTGKDGSPACATVKAEQSWKAV
ncbi:MAG TPA: DUF5990 family protein [Hyphomonadaceae bacterium]|nr:DUF5990 family protein [Hyphomonadaceae bacterium]